jgi:hypothetical protein
MATTSQPSDKDRILDKAKEIADGVGEKVRDVFTEHGDKIDNAVDKAGEFIDDKTKGRFTEHIGKAQKAAHSAVGKLSGEGATETDSGTPGDAGTGEPGTGAKDDDPGTT